MDDSIEAAKSVPSLSAFVVNTNADLTNTIMPFFDKYSLLTAKSLDYSDWKSLISMKKDGNLKTESGINKMLAIKSNMNRSRTNFNPSELQITE